MKDLNRIDAAVSGIEEGIDIYRALTPVNLLLERDKFMEAFHSGRRYDPVYSYRSREFPDTDGVLLNMLELLDPEDPLDMLFIEKIDMLLSQLELLKTTDMGFAERAADLFGKLGPGESDEAIKILEDSVSEGYVFPPEDVPPSEMVRILSSQLKTLGFDWCVRTSSKIVPKVTVSGRHRTILVNESIPYTYQEIERLRVHEIEVHVARGENGRVQPYRIFSEGLAGYGPTEEGLAIEAEKLTGCLERDTRQMKLYAGRALASMHCLEKGFYDVFRELRKYFPFDIACRLTERAKRGMRDTSVPGGICNGHQYISGKRRLEEYLSRGGSAEILFSGKIGVQHADTMDMLKGEGVLEPPVYVPEIFR